MRRARRECPESVALDRRVLLTAREGQVFALLGRPMSADEIAATLRLKRKTVDTHLDNIGRKLGWTGAANLRHLSLVASYAGNPAPPAGGEIRTALREQIEHQSGSRRALIHLLERTGALTGDAFLDALPGALIAALGVRLAAVVMREGEDPERMRVESLSVDGAAATSPPFSCAGTSLEGAVERFIEGDVARAAPEDPFAPLIGARSCHAIRLEDDAHEAVGGLVLMHDRPFDSRRTPELILRLVAGRAAAELARMRSERRLRESEQRYRMLADLSSDIVSRHTLSGAYSYVSPSIENVLGWKPSEMVGRSGYELVVPEDIREVGPVHHAVLQDGRPRRIRFRVRHRNGSTVWLDAIIRGVPDAETGQIVEILAVARDVTAEEALRRGEPGRAGASRTGASRTGAAPRDAAASAPDDGVTAREHASAEEFRALVLGAPDGIVVHDHRSILFANAAFARFLGAGDAAALRGERLDRLVAPLDLVSTTAGADDPAVPPDRAATIRLLRRDGGVVSVRAVAAACTFNGRPAVQLVVGSAAEPVGPGAVPSRPR